MKSDPRYGKPQPKIEDRLLASVLLLWPALLVAMELIN